VLEVREGREDAAIARFVGLEAELLEHGRDVLLDTALGDEEGPRDRLFDFPSAMSARTAASRSVSRPICASRARRLRSWATTSGSNTVAPAPIRSTVSTNSPTSATRSFSR
jgi:hypothetical protein